MTVHFVSFGIQTSLFCALSMSKVHGLDHSPLMEMVYVVGYSMGSGRRAVGYEPPARRGGGDLYNCVVWLTVREKSRPLAALRSRGRLTDDSICLPIPLRWIVPISKTNAQVTGNGGNYLQREPKNSQHGSPYMRLFHQGVRHCIPLQCTLTDHCIHCTPAVR